jgi:hypothetical protein
MANNYDEKGPTGGQPAASVALLPPWAFVTNVKPSGERKPPESGAFVKRATGLEPATLSLGS